MPIRRLQRQRLSLSVAVGFLVGVTLILGFDRYTQLNRRASAARHEAAQAHVEAAQANRTARHAQFALNHMTPTSQPGSGLGNQGGAATPRGGRSGPTTTERPPIIVPCGHECPPPTTTVTVTTPVPSPAPTSVIECPLQLNCRIVATQGIPPIYWGAAATALALLAFAVWAVVQWWRRPWI